MKKKIVSICLTAMLVGGLSMTSIQEARAAEGKVIDGSVLTHDEESIGYDTKGTGRRFDDRILQMYKIRRRQNLRRRDNDCETGSKSVQIAVMVERAKEEDTEWSYYDGWQKENKNTNRAMSNRTLYVDGGYYYRVRCTHVANSDMSSSFTDGIYID